MIKTDVDSQNCDTTVRLEHGINAITAPATSESTCLPQHDPLTTHQLSASWSLSHFSLSTNLTSQNLKVISAPWEPLPNPLAIHSICSSPPEQTPRPLPPLSPDYYADFQTGLLISSGARIIHSSHNCQSQLLKYRSNHVTTEFRWLPGCQLLLENN